MIARGCNAFLWRKRLLRSPWPLSKLGFRLQPNHFVAFMWAPNTPAELECPREPHVQRGSRERFALDLQRTPGGSVAHPSKLHDEHISRGEWTLLSELLDPRHRAPEVVDADGVFLLVDHPEQLLEHDDHVAGLKETLEDRLLDPHPVGAAQLGHPPQPPLAGRRGSSHVVGHEQMPETTAHDGVGKAVYSGPERGLG